MRTTRRIGLAVAIAGFGLACAGEGAGAAGSGPLLLRARHRVARPEGGEPSVAWKTLRWDAGKTAIIVVDMWNEHWCKGATRRVAEMAPRMNRFIAAARERGVLIVHAPSGCMKAYEGHPARRRARSAPRAANLPAGIAGWCKGIPAEEGATWPIDQSDGGCDCEPRCKGGSPWRREIEAIEIRDEDAISDSGVEIWNLFETRGIRNVVILGVHTNMCVIGRPFGLRNMARFGKDVVLVRDLTDTMYNSRRRPFVSHFRGTDLVIAYIERYVCPTITSCALLGGAPFHFKADVRPHVVIVTAERLYRTAETLPRFADAVVGGRLGLRATVLRPGTDDPHAIPGLAEALEGADLLVLSVRRRALPRPEMDALRSYLAAGRPLVALRTSSHAFDARGKHPPGRVEWPDFDATVLGGHYHGHHAAGRVATIRTADGAAGHPILEGIRTPFESHGSLYRPRPLAPSARPLLIGSIPGEDPEPVAWTHTYEGGRIFYTSLGHPDDFANPAFERLLANAVAWALGKEAR